MSQRSLGRGSREGASLTELLRQFDRARTAEERLAAAVALWQGGHWHFELVKSEGFSHAPTVSKPQNWVQVIAAAENGIRRNGTRIIAALTPLHRMGQAYIVEANEEIPQRSRTRIEADLKAWLVPNEPRDNPDTMIAQLCEQWRREEEVPAYDDTRAVMSGARMGVEVG